jgi:2-oxoglutarate/2-oxoacid ferredoxin oxidoreductase subunit beta
MLETYRNESDYPFCPGCGHGLILNSLNQALVKIQLDPRRTVLVTDIGCHGLADQYFVTNAFHGLHGRSIAYASGIKLARPDLKVIVLIGDGGTGIGGAHLLNAARRNIGISVFVFNNFNFGMTGGEHSVTTPCGAITASTRTGNLERPLDLCATVAVNGAGLAWRGTAFDRDLADVMAEAIQSESFALLDIWELCTAYFVPSNDFARISLSETRARLGMQAGYVARDERPEFSRALRAAAAAQVGQPALRPLAIAPLAKSSLTREYRLVIAGSAGGKVRSTARLIGEAALLSGLHAAQQDDYPVTVQTGHSLSELVLSPSEILFTGISRPDALILASEDGRRAAGRHLEALGPDSWLFVPPELADVESLARKVVLETAGAGRRAGRKDRTLLMAAAVLRRLDLLPIEMLGEAIRRSQRGAVAEANMELVAASAGLAAQAIRGEATG